MRRVAAPLAAVLLGLAVAGCGGEDGAEPGAPKGATLVLDFQPNAVHAGIYAAQARDFFRDEGVDLTIREPSSTADSAKLLEAGRADFAIMDINDFGIARERGLDIVAIAAVVQRPLASVIAGDRDGIRTPADLEGGSIGVTGVPSDDAVLDTVLAAGGVDPGSVKRITIGFEAVPALAAGRVDAATAFWNAEGVELQSLGVRTREFRVDEFGAPRYPELVLATSHESLDRDRGLSCAAIGALERGYAVLGADPGGTLEDLLDQVQGLDRGSQQKQLDALVAAAAFSATDAAGEPTVELSRPRTEDWIAWASRRGVLDQSLDDPSKVADGFDPATSAGC
jgi:NitT/TauT family transport system substrate-binding protein/putative hydroxymethylpyrimidine transport system substrate-binding protein